MGQQGAYASYGVVDSIQLVNTQSGPGGIGAGAVVGGLVGENGSGKSTLMRILVGDLRADAGTVTRRGQVGYCPQEPLVYPRLTCDEHFELFGRAYRTASPSSITRTASLVWLPQR